MNSLGPSAPPANSTAKPESPPIKLPNPPDDTQPETPNWDRATRQVGKGRNCLVNVT
jgi:hypothetical protein